MEQKLRTQSEALDAIIGKEIPVLDKGFIKVVDYMGNDFSVVQAARVSYGGGQKTEAEDIGLIKYLMRHYHTSPFEMCDIKLHIKMPIFIARQWIRHRAASVNEISGRYTVITDDFYLPEISELCQQSKGNKQGRAVPVSAERATEVREQMEKTCEDAFLLYNTTLESDNLARELARIVLPQGAYTEIYWKINLHNLLHFITLRTSPGAQKEIREYANIILNEIVKIWVPRIHDAFVNYRLEAETFSVQEMAQLSALIDKEKLAEYIAANKEAKGEKLETLEKVTKLAGLV